MDGPTPAATELHRELTSTWTDTIGCAWTAVTCWGTAWFFLMAWWRPLEYENGRWVKLGVGLMVLEFILVHSAGVMHHLMDTRGGWGKVRQVGGLTALYLLFGVGIALAFRSWWLLGTLALVLSGRVSVVFSGVGDMGRAILQRRMVAGVLLYLGLMFATLILPVPRGGLTPGLVRSVWPDRGSGEWTERPEKALAMGAAYFLLLGLVELRPPRRPAASLPLGRRKK